MGNQQSTTKQTLSYSSSSSTQSINTTHVLSEPQYSQLLQQHINYMKQMLSCSCPSEQYK